VWVIFIFIIIIVILLNKKKYVNILYYKKYLIFFLFSGFIFSLITPLLNFINNNNFIDISDAYYYFKKGIEISNNINFLSNLDVNYKGYSFILSTIYFTSFGNLYLYSFFSILLNFLLLTYLFLKLLMITEKRKIRIKKIFIIFIIFNPANYLISLSTTRDIFILFIIFNIFLELYFFKKTICNILKILIYMGTLIFFRGEFLLIIVASIFGVFIIKYNRYFLNKKKNILILISIVFVFVLMIYLLPISFTRSLLVAGGGDYELVEKSFSSKNVLPPTLVYSLNKKEVANIISSRILERFPVGFFGGSYLKLSYMELSGEIYKGFYNSNILKSIFNIFYDIYRYWLIFPLIFIFLLERIKILNKNFNKLYFSFSAYFLNIIIYTVKFGAIQVRNRHPFELIFLFSLFVYISENKINLFNKKYLYSLITSNLFALLWVILDPF